ncbi:MAG: tetratricopeptide repeat protein, partial [Bacteroidia bacterium]
MPTSSAQKGFMISRQELYRESIKICNKAIAIKPNSSYYLATRGVLKMETNQLQSAIYDFSKSLNIDSSDAIVFYNRGLCHRRMLHIDSAIADYKSCIRRDSNYAHALLNMGYAYMYKHDYEKAINLYTKALTKDSNLKSVGFTLNNIGYAYLKLENYKSALFYVNQSIKTYPINPYAYRNLALIQLAQNDSKQACKSLDKSIELGFVQQYGDEVLELKAANCR